jgi:beta-mannosidase
MACNFGWDWGPQLTTSGLWRAVVLEQWDVVRIRSLRARARVATAAPTRGEAGRVDVGVDLDLVRPVGELRVRCTVTSPDGELVASGEAAPDAGGRAGISLDVVDIARWWPTGYGSQPCYRIDVEAGDDRGRHDRASATIGYRDVRLDTSARPDGRTFAVHVNGERIWGRGVNWIPADCFPARNHGALVSGLLDAAAQANANLVRVWGGGVYESDGFYAECDRRGLLVWQDFAFACAAYPEALLHDEVAAEAVDNIARLASHPSLALWCGNNECLEGWSDWGWQAAVGDRPWGEGFYRGLLPELVAEHDPDRPYIDGTPTALDPAIAPNGPDHGTVHLWDVWNRLDYEHYRAHRPRFAAEFGFQAPATAATLAEAVTARPLAAASPPLQHHQKAVDGEAKLRRSLQHHFGTVDTFDDWLYLTQVNQARAVEVGVGHLRSLHERCSGAIWWQLDDCWPAISWAVIDRAGRRKPAWYALRRAFADRLLVFDPHPDDDHLDLVIVNDAATAWEATVTLHPVSAGEVAAPVEVTAQVEPRASARVDVSRSWRPGDGLLVATAGELRAVHGAPGSDRQLPAPRWSADVEPAERSVTVTVTASTFVRDLCLFADRVDPSAQADEQLVTLLPGESHTFVVSARAVPEAAAWNALVRPGGAVLRAIGDRRASDDRVIDERP